MNKSRPTLTPAEIEIVRKSHAIGVRADFVARQLKCSVRAISKPPSDKPPRAPARPNLYTSDFKPT